MNCLRCNTPNEDGAKFCKNCGMDLTRIPTFDDGRANQTINLLLLFMSIELFIMLGWFILQKVIIPAFYKHSGTTDWAKVDLLYKYFGWTTDIISILALLIFSILVKQPKARIFLIIFLAFKVIFLIGYRVFDQA